MKSKIGYVIGPNAERIELAGRAPGQRRGIHRTAGTGRGPRRPWLTTPHAPGTLLSDLGVRYRLPLTTTSTRHTYLSFSQSTSTSKASSIQPAAQVRHCGNSSLSAMGGSFRSSWIGRLSRLVVTEYPPLFESTSPLMSIWNCPRPGREDRQPQ